MSEELKKGTWLGDCELVMKIGRGGMASVWVAKQHTQRPEDARLVAVKVMLADLADDAEFLRMFQDEVHLVSRVDHENVVRVHRVGEHHGRMYMVMEWVEGDSLHTLIMEAGRRRAIPAEIAVRIIADAAAGLHAAHELRSPEGRLQGVVHRDVSPHNILIGTNGMIKLVDFGVAKALGRLSEATRVGQLKGKFGYMSPEQATGKAVDCRSDVFSLGIVLFELTTNRRLFRGETDVETLRLVISGQVPRPTKIDRNYPTALETIVLKALERAVDRRYQTALELRQELLSYLKSERIVVPQSGVASLLKRVTGARIEQRRKAIRSALRTLSAGGNERQDLISSDPAFTPTGRERITLGGDSSVSVSQVTNLSPPGGTPSASRGGSQGQRDRTTGSGSHASNAGVRVASPRRSTTGYLIGVVGFAVALFVAYLMYQQRHQKVESVVDTRVEQSAEQRTTAKKSETAVERTTGAASAPARDPSAKGSPPAPGREGLDTVSLEDLDLLDAAISQAGGAAGK